MISPPIPKRRQAGAQLRYLWALLKRFKVTFLLLAVVQVGGSAIFWVGYRKLGIPLSFAKAMGGIYFLIMGQPVLELPDSWLLLAVTAVIPPLGIAVVADGLVRFAFLFFAKHKNDKEWISVLTQSYENHVVLCGAGRVGYRILEQLLKLGAQVVVVERNESAPFVLSIRNAGVALIIDDLRANSALEATNVRTARTIICATDDDLANLNIALDARRLNPKIHVVMRFFDEDLVAKVKDAFKVEALSTSALAAPAFAASALDSSISNSFELAGELYVVGQLTVDAVLAGKSVAQARHSHAAVVMKLSRAMADFTDVGLDEVLKEGDRVIVQATFPKYQRLRAPS